MITCKIPVSRSDCEDKRIKCIDCIHKDQCDYFWISQLWEKENKLLGKDSLLGPLNPAFVKPDVRANKVISVTGQYDFCCFNVPKSKDVIVISDIYVDEKVRGQHISSQLLQYLMEKYDRDIFAKCVRGTSAEQYWAHIGEQLDANVDNVLINDKYEHRSGKRDLSWYLVKNKNKKQDKLILF